MPLDASLGELTVFAISLIGAGAVTGVLAGMFGIGGGAVLVPVLYQFLALLDVDPSIRMHISVGTSLGIIIPTSIRSFGAHRARGAVDMALLRSWAAPILVGVVIASLIANQVSEQGLKVIFGALAFVIGVRLIVGTEGFRLGADIPGQPYRSGIGILIGIFATLMGVGGGVMNNTVMTLYGRPIHQAVATSSGLGVLISIPGAIGFMWAGWGTPGLPPLSLGYVNLLGVLLIMPVSALVAPIGVRIAHAMPKRRLETVFGIFLLLIAIRFIFSIFAG